VCRPGAVALHADLRPSPESDAAASVYTCHFLNIGGAVSGVAAHYRMHVWAMAVAASEQVQVYLRPLGSESYASNISADELVQKLCSVYSLKAQRWLVAAGNAASTVIGLLHTRLQHVSKAGVRVG
jgi:hypothetical protein